MLLSKDKISEIKPVVHLQRPSYNTFSLPEKILQFGTGVLLRGLPDYFVDKANKKGTFNGRVVMVKSTNHGNIDGLRAQDNLYTLCVRGLENGEVVEEYYLNNSVSRILTANEQWNEILQCASNEDLQIIISNTTEVGIQLTDDDIHADPPGSFPGKLLAFLYMRYKTFNGDESKGIVIIPTELIVDNGDKLKDILIKLSHKNNLSEDFIQWLQQSNAFCNSLVDRIVPGRPDEEEKEKLENQLGYKDNFLIKTEPYRLWAIETPGKKVNDILSFSTTDKGVILTNDITKYRKLKLRLLNGTHTFSCALAYLNGFETVKEAMEDNEMAAFIQKLMEEIAFTIANGNISLEEAHVFSNTVTDRFKNPFIVHRWLDISLQYSSKMKMRNVPLLLNYYKKTNRAPGVMSKGLAAYILFMRSEKSDDGSFTGRFGNKPYKIQDDKAEVLYKWWKKYPDNPTEAILSDTNLWETDLAQLPGLAEKTNNYLQTYLKKADK
jgi:tagaturonate reductase